MKNNKRVRVLEVLLDVLEGKCSNDTNSCPSEIYNNIFDNATFADYGRACDNMPSGKWNCDTCIKNFISLNEKALAIFNEEHANHSNRNPCPCTYLPFEECEARVKEMIKEYS